MGETQVMIQVNTSSVNPCDLDLMESHLQSDLAVSLKKTLGFDVSGVVVAVGSKCTRIKVGDEVWTDLGEFGVREEIAEMGAFAEYAVADEKQVGLKPTNLDFVHAGVVPLVGLTGFQALVKGGAPWNKADNKTVLVTSGQGGTGHVGVQLAKALGAGYVISVASTPNIEWVKSLGADKVVDYTKQSVWDVLANNSIDMVYDNYGAEGSAEKAMNVLRPGGYLVMIAGKLAPKAKEGVKQYHITCEAGNHDQLDQMKEFFEQGKMVTRVQQSFWLEDIGAAYTTNGGGNVVGKLAVRIRNSAD
jgi:NADPH:quinone reductase-like Zn-dependent oxidoreductase